jgi:DNA-binding CsgD family transcriptional regulator
MARSELLPEVVAATAETTEWRVVPTAPVRIATRKGLVVTALDPRNHRRGAVVSQGCAGQGWREYAESLWEQGRPWSLDDARRLNTRQRDVVELLGEGLDDEAIARRLDISVRTVRRHVAELMREHGVRSRFQLGAALAQG